MRKHTFGAPTTNYIANLKDSQMPSLNLVVTIQMENMRCRSGSRVVHRLNLKNQVHNDMRTRFSSDAGYIQF